MGQAGDELHSHQSLGGYDHGVWPTLYPVAAAVVQLESAIKSERLKEAQARGRERGRKMGRTHQLRLEVYARGAANGP